MGSVMGAYATATNRYDPGNRFGNLFYGMQNLGLTSIGAWNQTLSRSVYDGAAGIAVTSTGIANQVVGSNGSQILGSGNVVQDSLGFVSAPDSSTPKTIDAFNATFQDKIRAMEDGAQLIVGHSNLATVTSKSQIYGHRNQLKGTPGILLANLSDLVSIWGDDNVVATSKNLTLIGDGNAFTNAKSDIVMGTFSSNTSPVTGLEKSVLLGGLRSGGTVDNSSSFLTLAGYGAEVHDQYAVALGAGSVARGGANNVGYQPVRATPVTPPTIDTATATWTATKNAVSVGAEGTTRQITGVAAGTADTDAVNVAQLKALREKIALTYANGSATTFSANGGDETNLNGDTTKPQNLKFTKAEGNHLQQHYDLTLSDHLVFGAEPDKNKVEIDGDHSTMTLGVNDASKIVLNGETGVYRFGEKVTINAEEGWVSVGDARLVSETNTVEGLSNRTWNPSAAVIDRQATEDQLKAVDEALRGNDPLVHELKNDMRSLKRDIRQMAAQAGAIAGLKTLSFDPYRRTQFMAAVGQYRDRTSVAVGLAHYPREKLLVHAGLTLTGHAMGYAGVSFTLGGLKNGFQQPANTEVSYVEETDIATLKAEIAQMQAQADELDALRAEAQALARRAQALAEKVM